MDLSRTPFAAILLLSVPLAASSPDNDWTRVEGAVTFRGTDARFTWSFHSSGAFRRTITGRTREVTVFDGERVLRTEDGGPAFELECFARERALLEAAAWNGSWRALDELRVPGGLLRAKLEVQGEERDPARLVVPGNGAGDRFDFEGWSDQAGGRWPARVTERTDNGLEQIYTVASVTPLEGASAALLSAPATESPAVFHSDVASAIPVHRARTGHLFVKPTVNGEDVGWFLFDSGAGGTLLSPEVSERLGLEPFGAERLTPFGPQAFDARLREVANLRLGPLEMRDLVVVDKVGPDLGSRLLGEPVAGVLGWDVFLRSVVTIDPREPSIEIRDPRTFELVGAAWQPLSLHWKVPYVSARFDDSGEGLFCLDTGAGDAGVIFHAAAVERLALLEGRDTVEVAGGGGPGGDVAMRRGELDWIELAGTRQTSVPAVFSVGDDGEDDPYTLGFVGAGVLGPIDLVYDYSRRRVAFLADEAR